MDILVAAVVFLGALAAIFLLRSTQVTTVYDYEEGLKYVNGTMQGVISAGRYRHFGGRTTISKQDMRPLPLLVTGQEMPTKDNVGIRLSLTGHYLVTDIVKAIHETSNYHHDLHTAVQLALRDVVSKLTLDQLLEGRAAVDAEVLKRAQPKLDDTGIEIKDLAIRDIVLPSNLKKSLSGVVEAQKDAQRNLERVRGEQAVLRSLANTARLFDGNPSLLNARLIQALEQGGNTIVFGADGMVPTPKRK